MDRRLRGIALRIADAAATTLVWFALVSAPLHAAEILVLPHTETAYDCDVSLEGQIRPGDAAKMERLLEAVHDRPNRTACLASTGGAYNEGVELAELFRRYALTTRILPGSRCFSACAIAFMGGTWDSESGEGFFSHRLISPRSLLGFHAPYLRIGQADFNQESVQTSYRQATRTIGRLLETSLRIDLDLKLVQEMLYMGPEELYMIDTVAKLGVYGIGLHGYAELPEFDGAAFHTCWNYYAWHKRQTVIDVFAENRKDEMPEQVHRDIVTKYERFVADPFSNPDEGATEFADYSFMPGDFTIYCKVKVEPAKLRIGTVHQIVLYTEVAAPNWEDSPPLPIDVHLPVWAQLDGNIPIAAIPEGPVIDLSYSFGYR